MSSQVEIQTRRSDTTRTAKHANRPRGGSNNQAARGPNRNARSNRGGKVNKSDERSAGGRTDVANGRQSVEGEVAQNANTTGSSSQSGGTDVCWICAEPVKYYALSECNHRTCHVCALRLRALYKKIECTFCKVYFNLISLCTSYRHFMIYRRNKNQSYSQNLPMPFLNRTTPKIFFTKIRNCPFISKLRK